MTCDLLPQFNEACKNLGLLSQSTLVIAVSGGADSMALLDLAWRAQQWRLVIYHLDHGLRPDAPLDAEIIRERLAWYAHENSALIPELLCEQEQVMVLAARWRCSFETAGRRHRYERLVAHARQQGAQVVLTAHHKNDQAETVLSNLLRGAGPRGIAGIPPVRSLAMDVQIARPLLHISRKDVMAYVQERSLTWREDITNTDERYRRNWLRRVVLPVFERGVPGITDELARLANTQRHVVDGEAQEIKDLWDKAICPYSIDISSIIKKSERLRLAWWRHLLTHLSLPLARRHMRRLDDLAQGKNGRRMTLGHWMIIRRGATIMWESAEIPTLLPSLSISGSGYYQRGAEKLIVEIKAPPKNIYAHRYEAFLNADMCQFPLTWRLPLRGERWQALGSSGTQTISRWLANRGVNRSDRLRHAVIADEQGIVWIPGHTIAERCRVQAATAEVINLQLTPAQ